jgi:glucan endo-1,3-alpha-glucosidase
VSYAKNWLFYSEELWKIRWDQALQLGQRGVNMLEIVTWNDYGEAHHIGPYSSAHTDDGASKWAEGLDHSAMLDFSVPYIEAFKQGKTEPVITTEALHYWHRPHLKTAQCDSSDNCGSKPNGWEVSRHNGVKDRTDI